MLFSSLRPILSLFADQCKPGVVHSQSIRRRSLGATGKKACFAPPGTPSWTARSGAARQWSATCSGSSTSPPTRSVRCSIRRYAEVRRWLVVTRGARAGASSKERATLGRSAAASSLRSYDASRHRRANVTRETETSAAGRGLLNALDISVRRGASDRSPRRAGGGSMDSSRGGSRRGGGGSMNSSRGGSMDGSKHSPGGSGITGQHVSFGGSGDQDKKRMATVEM